MLFYVYMKYFFPFSFNWMTPFLFVPLCIVPVQKKIWALAPSICVFVWKRDSCWAHRWDSWRWLEWYYIVAGLAHSALITQWSKHTKTSYCRSTHNEANKHNHADTQMHVKKTHKCTNSSGPCSQMHTYRPKTTLRMQTYTLPQNINHTRFL